MAALTILASSQYRRVARSGWFPLCNFLSQLPFVLGVLCPNSEGAAGLALVPFPCFVLEPISFLFL